MSKFAKIIEIEEEQVLLTVNYNDEHDIYEVAKRTDFKGIAAKIEIGFGNKEEAVEYIKDFTYEEAVKFRSEMIRIFS